MYRSCTCHSLAVQKMSNECLDLLWHLHVAAKDHACVPQKYRCKKRRVKVHVCRQTLDPSSCHIPAVNLRCFLGRAACKSTGACLYGVEKATMFDLQTWKDVIPRAQKYCPCKCLPRIRRTSIPPSLGRLFLHDSSEAFDKKRHC